MASVCDRCDVLIDFRSEFVYENESLCERCFAEATAFKQDKSVIHENICEELTGLYKRKNADYGDSFAKARKEIPHYTLGKLYDKFERYKQLSKQDRQVEDETVIDTLIDMGNYVIMELLERRLEVKEDENNN